MLTYNLTDTTGSRYKALYQKIKEDILSGTLAPGEKLPSKRTLAVHLDVSVITIDHAYQLLMDEGYVTSKERSGYYVHAPIGMTELGAAGHGATGYAGPSIHTSTMQTSTPSTSAPLDATDIIRPQDFSDHMDTIHLPKNTDTPALSPTTFPLTEYQKVMRYVITNAGDALLQKSPSFGCDNFREAIASYLLRYRGMQVDPEQIIIGSGSEYFYGMLVMFFGRDKIYGLEDPSYDKIRQVYQANGATCEMLPMGHQGIRSDALSTTKAHILHVTPFHSFPTGITAPAAKRLEYLAWAEAHEGYIIEDDIDSEFAVGSKPVETIFSMDQKERVIYMNTFSKSIAPSVRISYLVLPKGLLAEYRRKLSFYSCTVPTFDQYVLAEFMQQGYFERHLNRMRRQLRGKK